MKTQIALLLLQLTMLTSFVQAQAVNQYTDLPSLRRYVTNVRLLGQSRQEIGVLFAVTDSTLVLAPIKGLKSTLQTIANQRGGTLPPVDSLGYFVPLRTYKYNQISRLSMHRRGVAGKGLLIGIGLGALAGVVLGDDPPGQFIRVSAGDKAIGLGSIGALAGLIAGATNIKSVYARKQSVATEMQGRLREFAIVEQLKVANIYMP